MLTKWLGALETAVIFGGFGGLALGIYLLASKPLPGVLVMLASMSLLASLVGKLGETQESQQESDAGRERFSPSRASRYAK